MDDGGSVSVFLNEDEWKEIQESSKTLASQLFDTLRKAPVVEGHEEDIRRHYFEITASMLDKAATAFLETKVVGKLGLSMFREFNKIPYEKLTGRETAESLFKRNKQIMTLIDEGKFKVFVRENLPT